MAYYVHHLDPFLWQWGEQWGIRYYGVAYLLGFLAFYGGMSLFYACKWSDLSPEKVSDLLLYMILGVLIGGRLGYCFFYDLHETLRNPLSIINFWSEGGIRGMSSHGGILGVTLACWLYTYREKIDFWKTADHICILAPIGIFLGRVANFINGELWGRVSEVPWAVIFPDAPLVNGYQLPRHPSQLYEALGEGLFLFLFLLWLRKRGWSDGKITIIFFLSYAIIRIFLEFFREPDTAIGFLAGGLSLGQWLSFALILISIFFWLLRSRQNWQPSNLTTQ